MKTSQPTLSASQFQTPPRILIPKLVRSRDAWKAKAAQRKTQRKALEIRVRDLEASRDLHRQRAGQLQERVNQLEAELADAKRPAPAPTDSPKNSTRPAADTTTSPLSVSL
jgi:chromosome segregation ATPase